MPRTRWSSDFYWGSRSESQRPRNIAEVAIALHASLVPIGDAEPVYLIARTQRIGDLGRRAEIFRSRPPELLHWSPTCYAAPTRSGSIRPSPGPAGAAPPSGQLLVDGPRAVPEIALSGSFTTAARLLGSTQPTISRQVAEVEAAAGPMVHSRVPRRRGRPDTAPPATWCWPGYRYSRRHRRSTAGASSVSKSCLGRWYFAAKAARISSASAR